jgi:hypothetical protein
MSNLKDIKYKLEKSNDPALFQDKNIEDLKIGKIYTVSQFLKCGGQEAWLILDDYLRVELPMRYVDIIRNNNSSWPQHNVN